MSNLLYSVIPFTLLSQTPNFPPSFPVIPLALYTFGSGIIANTQFVLFALGANSC